MAKALIAPNPETALVQKQASELMPQSALDRYKLIVDQLVVTDEQSLAYANDVARQIAADEQRFENRIGPPTKGAYEAYSFLRSIGNPVREFLANQKTRVKSKIESYLMAERRRKQAEQEAAERLVEEARKKLELEAKALARKGQVAQAQEIRQLAQTVSAPVVEMAPAKLEGTRQTITWTPKIVNLGALLKAVLDGQVELDDTTVEKIKDAFMPYLKRQAAASRNLCNIPGVSVTEGISVGVRASD